jgi:O-antigen ligase
MSTLLLFVFLLLGATIPAGYMAAALPTLWLFQRTLLGEPGVIFSVGAIDLTMVDGVVISLLIRTGYAIVVTRRIAFDRALYLALGAFFLVNILAVLAAGAKFGATPMMRSAISLIRLGVEVSIVQMVAQLTSSPHEVRRSLQIVVGTLLVLGVIQFVNFFGASHGIVIGEVQGQERGELRYFGPVGDSVGFVLLLGYVIALCAARPVAIALFAGGIVLTAGIGAIVGLVVATLLVVPFGFDIHALRGLLRRWLWIAPVVLLGAGLAATTILRPMARTLTDRLATGRFEQSGGQRKASATLALAMIADNPLTGVGFAGYRAALDRYGGKRYFNLDKTDGGTANANNQWLQVLTDSGVPGLIAFTAFLLCAAGLLLRASRCSEDMFSRVVFRAACIWLLAQALGNLAAVWLVPSSYVARFLWVLLGLAVAAQRTRLREPAAEQPAERRYFTSKHAASFVLRT